MLVSYLFEAGWMFFATWSAIVAAAVVAAFGEDLLPSRAVQESPSPTPAARPGARSVVQ
jgi:hypothetical protein